MMEIRDKVTAALKTAMKAKDMSRLSTLRLINAAIKDRDIAARADGVDSVGEAEQMAILAKMVKQRLESAQVYEDGGRFELAEKEREEITVIEAFLPRQLSGDEVTKAVQSAITDTGADGLRDMGKVMAALKGKYTGQMDFGSVGPMVKDLLAG